jgi:hypothetical protein
LRNQGKKAKGRKVVEEIKNACTNTRKNSLEQISIQLASDE